MKPKKLQEKDLRWEAFERVKQYAVQMHKQGLMPVEIVADFVVYAALDANRKAEITLKAMRTRHEREIRELQERCRHPKVSGWLVMAFAGGRRYTSYDVKVCELCGKEMERRRNEERWKKNQRAMAAAGLPLDGKRRR